MSKIYTKTGDKGKTSLFDGTRVHKNHIRVEAYGSLDELNSLLGVVRSFLPEKLIDIDQMIEMIQKDLFFLGTRLANPLAEQEKLFTSRMVNHVSKMEKMIDDLTSKMDPLTNFILPGGSKTASFLHLARTVSRRVERNIVGLSNENVKIEQSILQYVNRLSDLLFTMGRFANKKEKGKEIIWKKFS